MTEKIAAYVVVILALLMLSFLLSYPLMLLWNQCLVPAVTTLKEVSWLQMWGIAVIIGLLFKTYIPSKS